MLICSHSTRVRDLCESVWRQFAQTDSPITLHAQQPLAPVIAAPPLVSPSIVAAQVVLSQPEQCVSGRSVRTLSQLPSSARSVNATTLGTQPVARNPADLRISASDTPVSQLSSPCNQPSLSSVTGGALPQSVVPASAPLPKQTLVSKQEPAAASCSVPPAQTDSIMPSFVPSVVDEVSARFFSAAPIASDLAFSNGKAAHPRKRTNSAAVVDTGIHMVLHRHVSWPCNMLHRFALTSESIMILS